MSFNKSCQIGNDFRGITITKPFLFILIVHLRSHLSFRVLAKRFTSAKVKDCVLRMTLCLDLSKPPSTKIQQGGGLSQRVSEDHLCLMEPLLFLLDKIDYVAH